MSEPALGIVVPMAAGETAWPGLLESLRPLLENGCGDVVLATTGEPPDALPRGVRRVTSEPGRARQLNAGAAAARGRSLWFVHADCRPDRECLASAAAASDAGASGLGWFRLRFAGDGPGLCACNAAGANWRAHRLGLPFGDQGFLLARHDFERLGGFDTALARGEDLDFAVRAGAAGIPPRRLAGTVTTSARRYREQGWLPSTVANLRDTVAMTAAARRRSRARVRGAA